MRCFVRVLLACLSIALLSGCERWSDVEEERANQVAASFCGGVGGIVTIHFNGFGYDVKCVSGKSSHFAWR